MYGDYTPVTVRASATPLAPTPSAARERIARIIDPSAFKNWQGQYDYGLKANSNEPEARRCADYFHKAACDEALVKADVILALLPDAVRAAAFEEAAEVADCLADEYDATSFASTNAEQVAALRSKEQAAHEIAAAIRAAGEK